MVRAYYTYNTSTPMNGTRLQFVSIGLAIRGGGDLFYYYSGGAVPTRVQIEVSIAVAVTRVEGDVNPPSANAVTISLYGPVAMQIS